MIIPLIILASGLSATLPLEEVAALPESGTIATNQSNVYYMWCAGGYVDSAGKDIRWQTYYFSVTSDNIDAFQDRVIAIVREQARSQKNLQIVAHGGNCSRNQTSPQDFNETRHSWEARARAEGIIPDTITITPIVEGIH